MTYAAAELDLTKPFVSIFVQRADVLRLPYSEEGRSLKENFSFIVVPQRVERDLRTFQDLVPFETLHVAVTAEDLEYADGVLTERIDEYAGKLGLQIVLVSVTEDVTESISRFGDGVEAVYITRLTRPSPDARSRFIQDLTVRKIPTFSMLGHDDVERGALAILCIGYTVFMVLEFLIQVERVDTDTIYASICVYLLMSIAWAFWYSVLYFLEPGSFSEGHDLATFGQRAMPGELYFSLVTLTTLGYGDVSPWSTAARMSAALEAVFGQIYVIVLVARLVGLNVSQVATDADA